MNSYNNCFLLFFLLSSATALDRPQSFLSEDSEDKRRLQLWNANSACPQRLDACEQVTSGNNLPLEQWSRILGDLVDDKESYLGELREIVDNIGEFDASEIFAEPEGEAEMEGLYGAVEDIETVHYNGDVATVVEALEKSTEVVGGAQYWSQLSILFEVIQFIFKLYIAVQGGPFTIFVFVVQQILSWLSSFALDGLSMVIFPEANPECMSQLVVCNYNAMLLTTVPALVGLAASSSMLVPPPDDAAAP